jgi:hypothetical protein
MRFTWWDKGILAFIIGFWILVIPLAFYLVGLFNFIGGDFAQFWAAAKAFTISGPASVYDQQILDDNLRELSTYYRPGASCFMQAFYSNDSALTGFTGIRPFFTWFNTLFTAGACNGVQDYIIPGIVAYPPILVMIFIPLTWLPPEAAFFTWSLISLALGIIVITRLAVQLKDQKWMLVVLLLLFAPVAYSIFLGQIILLLVFLLFCAYLSFRKGHEFWGGFWIGLLLVKPQYAVFFALALLVARRWKALVGFAISGGIILTSTVVILGTGGFVNYLQTLAFYTGFHSIQPMVHPEQMISWRGFLYNFFPGLSEFLGIALSILLSIATAALLFIVWRGKWQPADNHFDLQFTATVLITLLAGYHSHWYGAALLLVPGIPLLIRTYSSRITIWFFRVSLLLPFIVAAVTTSPAAIAMSMFMFIVVILGITISIELIAYPAEKRGREKRSSFQKGLST